LLTGLLAGLQTLAIDPVQGDPLAPPALIRPAHVKHHVAVGDVPDVVPQNETHEAIVEHVVSGLVIHETVQIHDILLREVLHDAGIPGADPACRAFHAEVHRCNVHL
jgi:hypothetical protein